MTAVPQSVPMRAWAVTFAGTAVNLCLGILYAWSVWKSKLIATASHPAGEAMDGLNAGWTYLTDAQATWAYSICGMTFALCMIPGGIIQDRFGPRIGAAAAGIFLATGCFVAGLMKSYLGLVVGFGLLGGIGLGLGYAAATPAVVKWFGPHQRGLVVGLVVGGFGAAAVYVSPLAEYLIEGHGISGSFYGLGVLFAVTILAAAQVLACPPAGYTPPLPASPAKKAPRSAAADWRAGQTIRTWQFAVLVLLFFGQAQSGLLVIANAKSMLGETAKAVRFLAANAWLLSSYAGLVNAAGRVGTGFYSDKLGRTNAYLANGLISTVCILAMPTIMAHQNGLLLFLAVGVVCWQYGGCLALMPSMTADFFGSKHLGFNYGLVFLGWGAAFFVPLAAGYVRDATGRLDNAFYFSGAVLVVAAVVSRFLTRPSLG